jgi:hypothetical protein
MMRWFFRAIRPAALAGLLLMLPGVALAGPPDQRSRLIPPQPSGPSFDPAQLDLTKDPVTNSLSVTHIEVTQSVQDVNHTVQVLSGRRTFVRVFFDVVTASGWGQISGRIIAQSGGATQAINATRSISILDQWNGKLELKRNWVNLGLLFELPPALVQFGQLTIKLDKAFDMYRNGTEIPCNNCATLSRTVSVANTAPLRLTVLGIQYSTGGQSYVPRQIDYDLIPTWLKRAYPISDVIYATRVVSTTTPWMFTCNDANTQVSQIRANDVNGGVDARTHYFGLVYDGGGFMRGCAAIPGQPTPSAIGSGPTGAGTWGWDTDGSYGDWYTGHELGHTLGRYHVGGLCGEAGIDQNYPFVGGQLSGGTSTFVGFDGGDSKFGIEARAEPGMASSDAQSPVNIRHDVMSYCTWQWISSYTYANIYARVVAENNLPSGPAGVEIAGAAPAAESVIQGNFMHILARLEVGWAAAKIVALSRVERATPNVPAGADAPIIETLGADGKVLARYPVAVFEFTDQPHNEGENARKPAGLISSVIPMDETVHALRIIYGGKALAERAGGSSRPVLRAVAAPSQNLSARITLSLGESPIVLSWDGSHAENRPLTYTVQISADAGASWETVAVNLTEPRLEIDPRALSADQRMKALSDRPIKYKIIASDGFHSTELVGNIRE